MDGRPTLHSFKNFSAPSVDSYMCCALNITTLTYIYNGYVSIFCSSRKENTIHFLLWIGPTQLDIHGVILQNIEIIPIFLDTPEIGNQKTHSSVSLIGTTNLSLFAGKHAINIFPWYVSDE